MRNENRSLRKRRAFIAAIALCVTTAALSAHAGDAEDRAAIVGKWKTVIGAKWEYRSDGVWKNAIGETGDWTVKGGRLIHYQRILGIPVETLNSEFVVTPKTLKIGSLIPMTRAD